MLISYFYFHKMVTFVVGLFFCTCCVTKQYYVLFSSSVLDKSLSGVKWPWVNSVKCKSALVFDSWTLNKSLGNLVWVSADNFNHFKASSHPVLLIQGCVNSDCQTLPVLSRNLFKHTFSHSLYGSVSQEPHLWDIILITDLRVLFIVSMAMFSS